MDFTKRNILKYVGDLSQVFGVKDYTLNGGKAQGVRAMDIKNGAGLEFTVLPDRGMDIAWLSCQGINLSYMSKTGIVAPQYYNEDGLGATRSFEAGFLVTCGLRNVGSPCEENDEKLGLHGRISNIPAENVSSGIVWEEGQPFLKVAGKMREAKLFGENLVLSREIVCQCVRNKFSIQDTVENEGFSVEPLMLLYHFNLGYPLLDENAALYTPTKLIKPRDEEAAKGTSTHNVFQKPTVNYKEQVFYHDLKTDADGNTCAGLINEHLEAGVLIRFNKKQLFNMAQWKQMGEGEYALALEPCNCYVEGRLDAKNKGVLEMLNPGETRSFKLDVEILQGKPEIERIKEEITGF
jgi:hypothetical protein